MKPSRLIWLAASLWLFSVWYRFGRDVPFGDTWTGFVPYAAGLEDLRAWVVAFHNVHWIPLPKLVFASLGAASGFDFRAVPLFNVLALSFAGLALVRASERLAGEPSAWDALPALALLHPGHAMNVIMGLGVHYSLASALACILLGRATRPLSAWTGRSVLVNASLVLALALCGLNGLFLALPLTCWLAWSARRARVPGWSLAPLAGVLLLPWVYFAGMPRDRTGEALTERLVPLAVDTLQFLGTGMGALHRLALPAGVLVAGLALGSLARIVLLVRRQRSLAPVAGALCCVGAGVLALAAATAVSRHGARYMPPRYITLAVVLLPVCALAWAPVRRGGLGRTAVALSCLGAAVGGGLAGEVVGTGIARNMDGFAQGVRSGRPSAMLAHFGAHAPARMRRLIDALEAARLGPYRDAQRGARFFVPVADGGGERARPRSVPPRPGLTQVLGVPAGEVRALYLRLEGAQPVAWKLFEVDADGGRRGRGVGRVTAALEGYTVLAGSAFRPRPGTRLELRLQLVEDGPVEEVGARVFVRKLPAQADSSVDDERATLDLFVELAE